MKIALIVIVLILSGCMSTSISIETILDDGSSEICTASYSSFARNVDGFSALDICGAGSAGSKSSTVDTTWIEVPLSAIKNATTP